MKNVYHLCISSRAGVLFRHPEDYRYFVNCIALTIFSSKSELLVDSVMSNHVHLSVITENVRKLAGSLMRRYTRYYNRKYSWDLNRSDISIFVLELSGERHILTAWSYILRNGLHHGLCNLAFGYKQSTVCHLFDKDFGRSPAMNCITSRSEILTYLPRHAEFPDNYVMDSNGMFLRESFSQIKQVEFSFTSPSKFLFYMRRHSDDDWMKEQNEDGNGAEAITLNKIEPEYNDSAIDEMKRHEYGGVSNRKLLDDEVCAVIDYEYVLKFKRKSVHDLTPWEKNFVAKELRARFGLRISDDQIKRCLFLAHPWC